ncbi:MAG: Holliday junction resolvase RuvX [Oscillospiraceae bacterium]|jgi:putative Holliday junction resolvase|nr:Holliday junction resolvase RuvX [Oscillospiraceae bacterium]
MRVLAIDLGDVRTGVALSDLTGTLAGRAFTIEERDMARLADAIAQLVQAEDVGEIVLGNPKNMDGSQGEQSQKSRAFKQLLEARLDIKIVLWDERLTSAAAHDILRQNGKRAAKHKKTVDAVAAALILESYLGR